MVLDGNLQVVYGGFGDGRTSYTRREFLYLTDTRFPDAYLYRDTCPDQSGQTMTVLLRNAYITDEIYYQHYTHSWRIWLLFIPLYLAGAGVFIWWMRRKIGRPLRRLNDAVVSQSEGRVGAGGRLRRPRGRSGSSGRALTASPTGWPRARRSGGGWTRAGRSSSPTSPTT